jgi:hypothetical protein
MSLKDASNQQSNSTHLSSALKGAFSGSEYGDKSEVVFVPTKAEGEEGADGPEWQTATYAHNRSYVNAARSVASVADSTSTASQAPWDVAQDPNRYRNSANPSPPVYKNNDNRKFAKVRAYVSTLDQDLLPYRVLQRSTETTSCSRAGGRK